MPVRGTQEERKAYERERKQRKRLEKIMQMPEPLRSLKLRENEYRRNRNLTWNWDKTRKEW